MARYASWHGNGRVSVTLETDLIFVERRLDVRTTHTDASHHLESRTDGYVPGHRLLLHDGMWIMTIGAFNVVLATGQHFNRVMCAEVTTRVVRAGLADLCLDVACCDLSVVAVQAVLLFRLGDEQTLMTTGGVRAMATSAGVLGHGRIGPIATRRSQN